MRIIGPKGKFTLAPDDDRIHLFISSGTGNAPFVAMMRELLAEGRPRPVVFLNGCSYERDLGYLPVLEDWAATGAYPVTFMPTVSRPDDERNAAWTGRTGPRRVDPRPGPRRARARSGQFDRLHLRQPGHDPERGGHPPRARLSRGAGPQGAVLAEGQGAARRGRAPTSPPQSRPPRPTQTSSRPSLIARQGGRRGQGRSARRGRLLVEVRQRVVGRQQVLAPIVCQVAPDRMDVIGAVLRVVVLQEEPGPRTA